VASIALSSSLTPEAYFRVFVIAKTQEGGVYQNRSPPVVLGILALESLFELRIGFTPDNLSFLGPQELPDIYEAMEISLILATPFVF